ncbi:MAG: DUF4403 family protein [Polyangiales bacterium]
MIRMTRNIRRPFGSMLAALALISGAACSVTINNREQTKSAHAASSQPASESAGDSAAAQSTGAGSGGAPEAAASEAKPASHKRAARHAHAAAPSAAATPAAQPVAPPPSAASAATASAPLPDLTELVVPVRVPFAQAVANVDALVEKTAKQGWTRVSNGDDSPQVEVKYQLWRDPVRASWNDDTLDVTVSVHYAADVRAKVQNPLSNGWIWVTHDETWGTKKEPQEITATFHAKVAMSDDFKLKAQTRLDPLVHGKAPSGDVCVQVLAQVCVSKATLTPMVRSHLDAYLTPRLTKALQQTTGQIEQALNLKARAQTLWSALQAPQSLQKIADADCPTEIGAACKTPAWLVAQPTALGVAGPRMDGDDLRVDLSITGRLQVALGQQPSVSPVPLPKLSAVSEPEGLRVHAALELDAPALSALLDEELKDLRFGAGKGKPELKVTSARVLSHSDAKHRHRITVVLSVTGSVTADITLYGGLSYDRATQTLSVASFDYTVETNNTLLKQLAGFDHDAFRRQLAAKAHWDLGRQVEPLKKAISAALNGTLRDQLSVSGELADLELSSFTVGNGSISADVVLAGDLQVTFTPK